MVCCNSDNDMYDVISYALQWTLMELTIDPANISTSHSSSEKWVHTCGPVPTLFCRISGHNVASSCSTVGKYFGAHSPISSMKLLWQGGKDTGYSLQLSTI